jgi:hypothetical protein
LYLGTPHQGSDGADLLGILLNVYSLFRPSCASALVDMKPTADFLYVQQQLYGPIAARYMTVFCYETLPTYTTGGSMLIVPRSSAVIGGISRAEAIGMPTDHILLSKYDGGKLDSFGLLIPSLRRMAEAAQDGGRAHRKACKGSQ